MEMKQKQELRKLFVPQLRQSLKVLALPLPDLKNLVEDELTSNPFLEETLTKEPLSPSSTGLLSAERRESKSLFQQSPDLVMSDNYNSLLTTIKIPY